MKLFNKFPVELQTRIFEFAASREPTLIEVRRLSRKALARREQQFGLDATIADSLSFFATTPPPALLHVNSLSRKVILRIYKPWLPQFKGSKGYEPFAEFVDKREKDSLAMGGPPCCLGCCSLSNLDNVFVNFEKDTLQFDEGDCSHRYHGDRRLLGIHLSALDHHNLQFMAFRMDAFSENGLYQRDPIFRFPIDRFSIGHLSNLRTLLFLGHDAHRMKIRLEKRLERDETDRRALSNGRPNYVAPTVLARATTCSLKYLEPPKAGPWYELRQTWLSQQIPVTQHVSLKTRIWTKYKYSANRRSLICRACDEVPEEVCRAHLFVPPMKIDDRQNPDVFTVLDREEVSFGEHEGDENPFLADHGQTGKVVYRLEFKD